MPADPAFHTDDTAPVAEYRTVSGLAIFSLVIGIAAPLCLAWPLLFVIPLIGVAVSIIAIRRIDSSEGALTGRWAAVTALMLCVFSGTAAVTRNLAIRYVRTGQAEELGREWIGLLLAGDKEQAFLLTVAGNSREPMVPEPGMTAPKETPYEMFLSDPVVAGLMAAGEKSRIEYAKTLLYEPQYGRQFIVQQKFRVVPAATAESQHPPLEVILTFQRSYLRGERRARWLVRSYESPPAEHEAARVH
jgi:hypothetical protein